MAETILAVCAYGEEYRESGCPTAHALCTEIDVQAVDEGEVEKRMRYGAVLSSLHLRPIEIWHT